jgi:hypothetical protein
MWSASPSKTLFLMAYISLCSARPRVLKSKRTKLRSDALVSYMLLLC